MRPVKTHGRIGGREGRGRNSIYNAFRFYFYRHSYRRAYTTFPYIVRINLRLKPVEHDNYHSTPCVNRARVRGRSFSLGTRKLRGLETRGICICVCGTREGSRVSSVNSVRTGSDSTSKVFSACFRVLGCFLAVSDKFTTILLFIENRREQSLHSSV